MATTDPVNTISEANIADTGVIADILADAFAEDPCMNWVIPAPQLYAGFYALIAKQLYMPHGLVFTDTRQRAAAMWLPPTADHRIRTSARQLWLVLRLVLLRGPTVLKRLEQAEAVMSGNHPKTPHYYLHAIGAMRRYQGQGLGSSLLKHMTPRLDAEGAAAYLESSSPKNIPLYERHGFEVTGQTPITDGGPPLYFMWREPLSN